LAAATSCYNGGSSSIGCICGESFVVRHKRRCFGCRRWCAAFYFLGHIDTVATAPLCRCAVMSDTAGAPRHNEAATTGAITILLLPRPPSPFLALCEQRHPL